jgi:hypothetical protein
MSTKLEDLGKLMRDNPAQLPVEVVDKIVQRAKDYAQAKCDDLADKKGLHRKTLLMYAHMAGATEYATKVHEVQGDLDDLKKIVPGYEKALTLLNEVFQKHESGLLPDRFVYDKIKKFLYGE